MSVPRNHAEDDMEDLRKKVEEMERQLNRVKRKKRKRSRRRSRSPSRRRRRRCRSPSSDSEQESRHYRHYSRNRDSNSPVVVPSSPLPDNNDKAISPPDIPQEAGSVAGALQTQGNMVNRAVLWPVSHTYLISQLSLLDFLAKSATPDSILGCFHGRLS